MKKIVRKNQLIITALALMIAVAGYLSYMERNLSDEEVAQNAKNESAKGQTTYQVADDGSYELSKEDIFTEEEPDETAEATEAETGEETAKATQGEDAEEVATTKEQDPKQEEFGDASAGEAVFTGSTISNVEYASEVKLSREQVRAQNKDTLLEIVNNENLQDEAKKEAIQQMVALTDMAEKENEAELLLEAKGFTDVVVSMTQDSVDVVLDMGEVTDAKRAQVEDIVKRKTKVPAENIVITPINVAK